MYAPNLLKVFANSSPNFWGSITFGCISGIIRDKPAAANEGPIKPLASRIFRIERITISKKIRKKGKI